MELLYLIHDGKLEVSLYILLTYLLCMCLFSLRNKWTLVITYIFVFYCCYAYNKEVIVETFGDHLHLFNILFFGFGILILVSVIYTLCVRRQHFYIPENFKKRAPTKSEF